MPEDLFNPLVKVMTSLFISSAHFGHSEFPISMATGAPRVRPWRTPPNSVSSSASKNASSVPAEAEAPTGQFVRDVLIGDGEPRWKALDDDHEGFAVGLSGSQETKHGNDRNGCRGTAR